MRVSKRKRRKNGKTVEDRYYTGFHRFGGDARETAFALRVTDKRVALKKLGELIRLEEQRREGLVIASPQLEAAQNRMVYHLADFVADLRTRRYSRVYVYDTQRYIQTLIRECGWEYPRHVTIESFIAWRSRRTNAPKTLNDYLAAVRNLMNWMKKMGRISVNPLEGDHRIDTRGKERITRRAITPEEFERLLSVSGCHRVLYLMAVLTGLRRRALYELRWGDVHLDESDAFMEVRAKHMKNRRADRKFLRDDLVAELWSIRATDFEAGRRVFQDLLPSRGLKFFKSHLKAAGIAYIDDQGDRFDFHALRHTAATWGGQTGIEGPTLQAFLSHRSASQTARYTHSQHLRQRDIVDRLPRFQLRTEIGTDDLVSHRPAPAHAGTREDYGNPSQNNSFQRERHTSARVGTACHKSRNQWAIQDSNL